MKDNIIPKQEAHLWLSLYEFFTSEQLRINYEITQFRKKNLIQVNLFLKKIVPIWLHGTNGYPC